MTDTAHQNLGDILRNILANARVQPDAAMNGTTDVYAVPLEDIEAARSALLEPMDRLASAREAFLDMIADAVTWGRDEDADCDEGQWRDLTTFKLVTKRTQLEEFASLLGIKRAFGECVFDAINRAAMPER